MEVEHGEVDVPLLTGVSTSMIVEGRVNQVEKSMALSLSLSLSLCQLHAPFSSTCVGYIYIYNVINDHDD